ncbi:MAG: hypothetical protein AB7P49_15710 [Bdellovibrionales bacterium]
MSTIRAYRRCHVCGTLSEAPSEVRRCSHCGKPFAPFYYFKDQFTPILADCNLRPPVLSGQWRPIHGLTAYWRTD